MKRVLALMLLLGTSAAADVVILNDGTRLEGQFTRSGSNLIVVLADGSTRQIDPAELQSVQKMPTAASPEAELTSLRRQLVNSTQAGVAAGRLRDFIEHHAGTPAAGDAQKDLDVWQHRADAGLVRTGSDWVTPEQFAILKSQSGPAIENVRALLAAGKVVEAQKALAAALKIWPGNSTLLYLNGVALYRSKQLVPAKQAFEAAAVDDPSNPAIHNNLAVILWQTHQQPGALVEYDRAITGDAVHNTIIDNINEALHALPPALASNPIARKLAVRVESLNAVRDAAMEKQGLHRYGFEWLDNDGYVRRVKNDHANSEFISTYNLQVHTLQRQLGEIDEKLKTDMETLHSIDQQSTQVMPDGSIIQFARPLFYKDVANEAAQLNIQKLQKTKELRSMPRQLADAQASTGPRWTGLQKLIGEDRTPPPIVPTTQP